MQLCKCGRGGVEALGVLVFVQSTGKNLVGFEDPAGAVWSWSGVKPGVSQYSCLRTKNEVDLGFHFGLVGLLQLLRNNVVKRFQSLDDFFLVGQEFDQGCIILSQL